MTKPKSSLYSRSHWLSLNWLMRIELVVLTSWSVLSLAILLLAETRTSTDAGTSNTIAAGSPTNSNNTATVTRTATTATAVKHNQSPQQVLALALPQSIPQEQQGQQQHILFILVGAIRTLDQTADSIFHNVIHPLCPSDQCTAHVVTHFSYTDNRPDKDGNDPRGRIVEFSSPLQSRVLSSVGGHDYTNNDDPKTDTFFPFQNHDSHLRVHVVAPSYNTGSVQEQAAMDLVQNEYEKECDYTQNNTSGGSTICMAQRMKIWRSGDPRRFSMWFARYWAWRFVQENLLPKYKFDLIAFLRPDMYWFQPLPGGNFFSPTHTQGDQSTDIWIHDSYYAYIPDTFAIMVNTEMAERYFSITRLLTPGVACLGGPNFDQQLVKPRLVQQGLWQNNTISSKSTSIDNMMAAGSVARTPKPVVPAASDIWCNNYNAGFSEHILLRKMRNANAVQRYIPAGAALLRPPHALDCQPLFMFVHAPWNRHAQNVAVPMACMAHKRAIAKEHKRAQDLVKRNNDTIPYQLVQTKPPHWCLTRMYDHLRNLTSSNDTNDDTNKDKNKNYDNNNTSNRANADGPLFIKTPCAIPYKKTQLFIGHKSRLKVPSWGFATEKFNFRLDPLDVQLLSADFKEKGYYEKPCELYSTALLQDLPRKIDRRPIQE